MRGKISAVVAACAIVVAGLAVPAEAATVYEAPLRTAARSLPVADEQNAGYDRDLYFGSWKDADRDCRNTRQEVLQEESGTAVAFSTTGCTAKTGTWVTTWDDRTHTESSTVQIDHTVPVHEAWGSGARSWTQERRVAFYNDLGDARSLNAQTSALNSSKAARGPEEWMPPANGCRYIAEWVAVKIRWGLTVDPAERAALVEQADGCADTTVTVDRI